ncbi:14326_t:CDS:1, partial [Ambispora leptoticha]
LQDPEIEAVNFANGRSISKFVVDCEEEVIQFLDKFYDVEDLSSLARILNENPIDMSVASNDLIFVRALFDHFFFLYKNDIMLQSMSLRPPMFKISFNFSYEFEANSPQLNFISSFPRNAFLINGVQTYIFNSVSAPRLDGKGLLKSLSTEILVQEDGVLGTRGKR